MWKVASTSFKGEYFTEYSNLLVADFQRCKHASGSCKEPEPMASTTGVSETTACPLSSVADDPSTLPSTTSAPPSSQ